MTADLILMLIILVLVVYSYTSTQNQFAATASALRQIWSCGCPLSYRQSEMSGLSSGPGSQTTQHHRPRGQTLPGCSCDNCPCVLIENFISSCRPSSSISTQLINLINNCISAFMQMITGLLEYAMRPLQCQLECQPRQAQIIDTSEASKSKEKAEEKLAPTEPDISTPTDKVVRRESKPRESKSRESKSGASLLSKAKPKKHDVDVVFGDDEDRSGRPFCPPEIEAELEPTSSLEQKSGCTKCINKGRSCVKNCPKAHK